MNKRQLLAELAADRNREGRGGRIVKRSLAALVVLLLGSLPVLWALGFFSTPPAVAEVRQLVDEQVAAYDRVARGEASFASTPSLGDVFGKMRDVPPRYREQAEREMGRLWQARERAETHSYFSLPPKERQAELDRRIKAEDERRQRWQAERGQRGQDSGGGRQDAGGGRARGGDAGRTGGGSRGWTEENRSAWAKRRIDRTTPDERAQRAEYRRAMEARRIQLGLPPGGGRRSG